MWSQDALGQFPSRNRFGGNFVNVGLNYGKFSENEMLLFTHFCSQWIVVHKCSTIGVSYVLQNVVFCSSSLTLLLCVTSEPAIYVIIFLEQEE